MPKFVTEEREKLWMIIIPAHFAHTKHVIWFFSFGIVLDCLCGIFFLLWIYT